MNVEEYLKNLKGQRIQPASERIGQAGPGVPDALTSGHGSQGAELGSGILL